MMCPPEFYIYEKVDADYEELIAERNKLIKSLQEFETKEREGDWSSDVWNMARTPSPEVVYQYELEYLSQLCLLMGEKYNHDFVWGSKSLSTGEGCGNRDKSNLTFQLCLQIDPIDPDIIKEKVEESRSRIRKALRALELPEDIQQKVISGEIELKEAIEKYLPDDKDKEV